MSLLQTIKTPQLNAGTAGGPSLAVPSGPIAAPALPLPADAPTSGREYLRWLRANEPDIFLPADWDAGAVDFEVMDPGTPDLGPDLDWPLERAPEGLAPCPDHGGLIWQSIAGDWQCVPCWSQSPPPRTFVRRVSGLVVSAGEFWVATPDEFNCWPERWWGRRPGAENTSEAFV